MYTPEIAQELLTTNSSDTWSIEIVTMSYNIYNNAALETYVRESLANDITSKYDGTTGLLNIADVRCTINDYEADNLW